MFRCDRQMGFASVTLFGVCLMVVWGWRGNLYGKSVRHVIRFDFGTDKGLWRMKVLYQDLAYTTDLYISSPWHWLFHSEHIAAKLGTHIENDFGPDYYAYNGWLGNHYLV